MTSVSQFPNIPYIFDDQKDPQVCPGAHIVSDDIVKSGSRRSESVYNYCHKERKS